MSENKSVRAISRQELEELIDWLSRDKGMIPVKIKGILERLIAVYSSLVQGAARAKQTLITLRQAMGILPKSEKGKQACVSQGAEPLPLPPGQGPELETLRKKRDELARNQKEYDRKIRLLAGQNTAKNDAQLEFDLGKPSEMLFSSPIAHRQASGERREVDRVTEFEKDASFHVAYDYPKRLDFKCTV